MSPFHAALLTIYFQSSPPTKLAYYQLLLFTLYYYDIFIFIIHRYHLQPTSSHILGLFCESLTDCKQQHCLKIWYNLLSGMKSYIFQFQGTVSWTTRCKNLELARFCNHLPTSCLKIDIIRPNTYGWVSFFVKYSITTPLFVKSGNCGFESDCFVKIVLSG